MNFLTVAFSSYVNLLLLRSGRTLCAPTASPSGLRITIICFFLCSVFKIQLVGQNGLEPSTSRLSVVCSSQLSYWPVVSRSFVPFAPAASLSRSVQSSVSSLCFLSHSNPLALGFEWGPRLSSLVEISGIEPLTSCLQGRRSPS